MKRLMYLSLSSLITLQSGLGIAVAAEPSIPSVGVIAGTGSGQTGFLTGGVYDITEYTKVMNKVLDSREIKDKKDRDYLLEVGKRLSEVVGQLIEKQKQFSQLSQRSQTTNAVTLNEYLTLVNDINALLAQIKLEIQESSMISMETLPSYIMKVGDKPLDIGPASTINITNAVKPFGEQAATLAAQMDVLPFPMLLHNGFRAGIQGSALTPDLSKFPSMTHDEIQAALLEVETLSTISKATKDKQQFLADLTVKSIKNYIALAGTDKFLQFRNNNDTNSAATLFKSIRKAMFLRSYLRKKYGLQIGGIQPVDYPRDNYLNYKDWASSEALLPIKTALNSIRSQTAQTDDDIMKGFENARQFVELYDKQVTPTLSKEASENRARAKAELNKQNAGILDKLKAGYDYLTANIASHEEIMKNKPVILNNEQKDDAYNSEDTGAVARISSLFLTVSGQMPTVEALLAVFRLVLADMREELMLSQGDYAAMVNYHNRRFLGNDEEKILSIKVMCDSDKSLTTNERTTLVDKANSLLQSFTPEEHKMKFDITSTFKCGNQAGGGAVATTGLLGGQRTGGANFQTQFNALIEQYQRFEVSRAQLARNKRQMIDASLNAQAQEGDATEGTIIEGL